MEAHLGRAHRLPDPDEEARHVVRAERRVAVEIRREHECVLGQLDAALAVHVTPRDVNLGALDGPLEDQPEVLDPVRVDVATHVAGGLSASVGDDVMVEVLAEVPVGARLVGVDHGALCETFALSALPFGTTAALTCPVSRSRAPWTVTFGIGPRTWRR